MHNEPETGTESNPELDLFGSDAEQVVEPQAEAPAEPPAPPPPPTLTELPDDHLPIAAFAERAYLAYAMSVVRGRALPQVEDGMKPVQRRILYSMHEMRLTPGAKPVKSARVVGDVIGKLHPHGDTAVYDAAVRLAQDFTLRYPLIDGQGNFGSRDGDGAAAMRYTEMRLTPLAELLLGEIDRGTVDFVPNYDGAWQEPKLFPARLPMLLLNGASGIAVGMATECPPHNLREVSAAAQLLIKKPESTLDDVMALLPGPDFPGGGQLISPPQALRDAYAGGRGSLRMRARWRVEPLARGAWRIIVNEMPHGVSVSKVLSEIEALTNPQPKAGKKEVSAEEKATKALVLGVLDTARDESSDKEAVRLVLEPKSRTQDPEELMRVLLVHTSLESSVSINLTVIGRDGRPAQKGLLAVLHEWIAFRFDTVERRTRHRLGEVDRRIHILEGRAIVWLHIDEVIRVIREAEEPKAELMARFKLSEIQAEDILEIRLRQLARLEYIKIESELAELRVERAKLIELLEDRGAMTRLILKEIVEDTKKFGDDRRTLIEAAQAVVAAEAPVLDEPVTVILSRNGWVRARQGHGVDRAALTYKSGDGEFAVIETRTPWPLLIIDTQGRAYSVRIQDLPGGRGDGVPITTLIELQNGARVAQALSGDPAKEYLFANSGSYGFITTLSELAGRNRAGKAFMTLEDKEEVLRPVPCEGEWIAAASANGRLLWFPRAEMKVMPRGRGVIVMGLDDKETLNAVACPAEPVVTVSGIGRGGKEIAVEVKGVALQACVGKRARKGGAVAPKVKPTGMS
ncbi:DNA topoisomerase IV subunit A [Niveibacterium umoris]|uniref:DNA topoisomerase 4 subunit A n=1 Tax=Niveibacterium umoris TaxID=1193620 RepID=A0A840BLS1_9RHOO|nr:DNA topoisomerase IV subunit A [Niveibacterium umoris]MBB4014185.1 topoisomerase-4 subunit A [Niveibacterium umoris]